ncbi:MAG: NADH-quinone oxidoreductase subunit J [Syntrophales bacterium]|nr:NADH-quinone oxidoreductase subunit J [Syntrophales bacterium]
MTLYQVVFYLLAGVVLAATVLAITRRVVVHAVVYLVISFLALAPMFYLLGAPLLALLEVILYAGAIMVLFLFIVMMLPRETRAPGLGVLARQCWPAVLLTGISLTAMAVVLLSLPLAQTPVTAALASPRHFGRVLFEKYWLGVEVASFLLFVALVGAYYLGKSPEPVAEEPGESS